MTHDQTDFIFGRHAGLDFLKTQPAKRINKVFLQSGVQESLAKPVREMAHQKNLVIQQVPKNKLDRLVSGGKHQGLVLAIASFDYMPLEVLLTTLKDQPKAPFLLMLDGIEDPHNLGSILRTADATGVDGIIIPKRHATGLTSVVAKASTGAIDHVPVSRVTNLVQTAQHLKDEGYWLFGTAMSGQDYRRWDAKGKTVLVIGNEGKGISPLLAKQMDQTLTIPMMGNVQSLNASVATSVLLYQMLNSRYPLK